MGTGAVSNLLHVFPYGGNTFGMKVASLTFFFLNLSLFLIFFGFSIAKYSVYPDRWVALTHNPVTSLYLGCFPMGLTTLVNIAVEVIFGYFGFGGRRFLYAIWSLWWVIVAISIACCWVGVHIMIVQQNHTFSNMTAMWLLPVVTLIVTASSGGVVALALQAFSPRDALITVSFSAVIVTVGLTLAFMIMPIYLARLIIHGLPPGASVLSVFLPLGPTGQSGFAMYLIARNLRTLIPYEHAGASYLLSQPLMAEFFYGICIAAAFMLWSLATMWLLYAILALYSTLPKSPPGFRMSFWGLVFPNAVYANLTISLGEAFDSTGFKVFGATYAVIVICVWISIATRSLVELKRMSDETYFTSMSEKLHRHHTEHNSSSSASENTVPGELASDSL
ncbi:sulphite efflux pump protein [Coprinopsis marcescibilis]|uniref:Sulphite efflux pump protein n=1 Tax=Coprinopsis marcescibilis TaxID=230819 RepID=A0A5C3KLD0_COPMA|nr:sulphite efflux pump protein [Coprinopsis marcescibilis]